ncbi:MAG: MATE family efflux transporter [Bacteroidetes bacterium]|nr:MAG: MATE family efflux transporter [Bacteroidota bacterium]
MNKRILQLALPNIVSNISIPLLGIVDMALMGHLESDAYIGAIALGSLIFNFIYWSLSFLRMGTSGFTAQAFGSGDMAETVHVLTRAVVIAAGIGLALLLLQRPIEWIGFLVLNAEEDVETLARSYYRIRIWAAPAALGQFALLGYFLGMQNARLPMIVLISTNVINLLCNYSFVMHLNMGSNGVALGTVIAQYSGLLIALFLLYKHFSDKLKHISTRASLQVKAMKAFLRVNQDIFIRTMCLVAVFSIFTARSASVDASEGGKESILAVNSLLMQFFMFFSFLIDGFAHAAEALTGRFIGEGNQTDLRRSIRLLFIWGSGIALVFTLIYLFAGASIFRLLTNNPELISNARPYFFWIVLVPMLSFAAFIWDGIYIGATAGREMRNAMLVSTVLVFFPTYFLARSFMDNHGLWLAFILFMAARGLTMQWWSKAAVYGK